MSEEKTPKRIFSQWLEQLQQESWQLELLISGFALFGIWESREWVDHLKEYLDVHNPLNSDIFTAFRWIVILFQAAWAIFFINLLIHVILRGLWIGAIGLRYVSGEIDYKSLNYSDFFHEYLSKKVGRFDAYIEKLEKICSVIFAYTFLLFFIFLSFTIFIIENIFLASVLSYFFKISAESIIPIILLLFNMGGIIVFLDFITLGSIKKIQNIKIAKGYSYLYRFYSFITLSFIYRPLLYNFIDFKETRRLFWFSIPYIIIITFIMPFFLMVAHPFFPSFSNRQDNFKEISAHSYIWHYYDNLREENREISGKQGKKKKIHFLSLGTNEVSGRFGKIFLSQSNSDQILFEQKFKIQPFRKSGFQHQVNFPESVTDTIISKIKKQRSDAIRELMKKRKVARKEKSDEQKSVVEQFKEGYNRGKYGNEDSAGTDFWGFKIDSTKHHWNSIIDSLYLQKSHQLKNTFLQLNQVYIDEVSYNDQLNCKFYIHPNLGEKGLLCYFPTDSLTLGDHLLTLKRAIYNPRMPDSLEVVEFKIPFFQIEK